MTARACAAILVACVVHSGDGGSRCTRGNDRMDEAIPAGDTFEPRTERPFAARRFVQRAVWVDNASLVATRPAGSCVEIFNDCADCVRNVAAVESFDPCTRANRRIAF